MIDWVHIEDWARSLTLKTIIGLLSAICGLASAVLWLLASFVNITPPWKNSLHEPVDEMLSQQGWLVAIMEAARKSAKLNAIAAFLTGVAALLGVIASLLKD